mmetsp:Transcript_50672/g.147058  ORF Transcript_50672/g.147058 Transcript_50672/m.147058 type:complete len:237 (-) Transcript_50672:710-1420(-)
MVTPRQTAHGKITARAMRSSAASPWCIHSCSVPRPRKKRAGWWHASLCIKGETAFLQRPAWWWKMPATTTRTSTQMETTTSCAVRLLRVFEARGEGDCGSASTTMSALATGLPAPTTPAAPEPGSMVTRRRPRLVNLRQRPESGGTRPRAGSSWTAGTASAGALPRSSAFFPLLSSSAPAASSTYCSTVVRMTMAVRKTRITDKIKSKDQLGSIPLRKTPKKVPMRDEGTTSRQML